MVSEQGEVNDAQHVASAWPGPGAQALSATLSRVVASASLEHGDQALLATCMEVARADCGYIAGFTTDLNGQRSLALWAAEPCAAQPQLPEAPTLLCASRCDAHSSAADGGCPCAHAAGLGRAALAALRGVRACHALPTGFASAQELVTIPLRGEAGRVCGVLGLAYHATHAHRSAEGLERQLGPLLELATLSVLRRAEQRTRALLAERSEERAQAPGAAARARIAERSDKAQRLESLGVLAGGIAHDFNNLLLTIMGNIGLSRLDLPPEHQAQRGLHQAEAAAQRAAGLCRQLLAYSGRGRFVLEQVDLSQLVDDLQQRLSLSLGQKTSLRLALGRPLPAIEGAAGQLRDLIASLVENASEAVGEQAGTVLISTGVRVCDRAYLRDSYLDDDLPEGQYVVLEVSDTGCGMTVDTRERIFEPFFSTKFMGRGLGLSSVLGIVRGHRGAIRIHPEEQRGTTLKVLLHALGKASERPRRSSQPTAAARPGTVLVVDDEAHVRDVTQRMLELAGFKVLLATDGQSALPLFEKHRHEIDVVLLDMTMPRLDGRETYLELSRIQPGVRVVLTSGYSQHDAFSGFQASELAGFLQKPYRAADLVSTLLRAQRKRP